MSSSLTSKSCCVCFSDFFSFAESLSLSSLSTIPLRRLNTLGPASVLMLVALADGWFTEPVRALLVGRRPLLSVSEDATTGWIRTYQLKLYTLKTSNWNPSLVTNLGIQPVSWWAAIIMLLWRNKHRIISYLKLQMNTREIHKKEVKLKIKTDIIKIKFKNSLSSFLNLYKGMSLIIYKLSNHN